MDRKKKNTIIAAGVLVVLVAALLVCWRVFMPGTSQGAKSVAVTITHADGSEKTLTLHTDAEYLWDAMYAEKLIDGTDGDYGKWVTAVDGETADEAKGQYWLFTKGGEWVETACDATPIADGDAFEFFIYEG